MYAKSRLKIGAPSHSWRLTRDERKRFSTSRAGLEKSRRSRVSTSEDFSIFFVETGDEIPPGLHYFTQVTKSLCIASSLN
jgi:hypothetical protein